MQSAKGAVDLETYVALLRAINVGGRGKVSMADLRQVFLGVGAEDVATYLQSGNVIFKSRHDNAGDLVEVLEEAISHLLGLSVTVLVRTKGELTQVVAANPFAGSGCEPAKLHVTFLADSPSSSRVRELEAKDVEPDEVSVVGREVYLHCPTGYGRSRVTNVFLEKQLGTPATTRSWKTVTKLAELAGS